MSNTQNNSEKSKETKDENIEIKELKNSEVEIVGEIPVEEFETYRTEAVKGFSEKVKIAGFRSGHIPENVLEGKFGDLAILEEMAQVALARKYPQILIENKIDAIGRPEITITKIAKGSPLGFKIKTAVMPVIELPDYKKIAKEAAGEKEEIKVEEKEVEDVITHIRKQRKRAEETKKTDAEKSDDSDGAKEDSKKENEEAEKSEDKKETKSKKKDEDLPELTDEVAKELGFEGVEDLKKIIRDNLKQEKEMQAKDKRRAKLIDALLEKSKLELPEIVTENELDRMMAQLKGEIANMGLSFEDYLGHVKKTEEDLRKASKPDAEKRAKSQLIINKIAVEEKIEPEKEAVEKELKHLTEHYADADPSRTRAYVEMILTNEAVLKFLEDQK